MPLDPQFRTILDTLETSGLVPLVRGDAEQTRAHYRTLALSRRGPGFVPEEVASVADLRSPAFQRLTWALVRGFGATQRLYSSL